MSDAMRGYGYSLPPAIVTIVVICAIRVIWVYTVFAYRPTYETLMMVYPLSWFVNSVCLIALYFYFIKKKLKCRRCVRAA